MKTGNCIVGQSGGPTCVINASLYGIIKETRNHPEIKKVFGCINGIDGVIHGHLIDLSYVDMEKLELLKQTPSAILGSVRHCLSENDQDEEYYQILNVLKKYQIKYFFYIGGNDSMDTVLKLSKFLKKVNYECYVIGIPKTIDNDLMNTDHTPGYGSAARFIANSICQIQQDIQCYKEGRVTIVEIMGRDAGWLAAASKLSILANAQPDLIYLPEKPFDPQDFLKKVKAIYAKKKKVLVCISEGIKDIHGNHLVLDFAYMNDNDVFGHMQLGGVSSVLSHLVKDELKVPVRAIELNLLQRCFSILASKSDIQEAIHCAKYALKMALRQYSGKIVCMERISSNPYQIRYVLKDIQEVANFTKYFPKEWILDGDVSEQYLEYALPLMSQTYPIQYENGLIKCLTIQDLK